MNTASRRTLAVLGSPIAHSKSPALHNSAYRALGLNWSYETHEVTSAGLAEFVASRGPLWRGLSLTMPLKHAAMRLVASRDRVSELTGAVNTVFFDDYDVDDNNDVGGSREATRRVLRGFNTDVAGIVRALAAAGHTHARSVHILGGGATAASALVAAAELGVEQVVVSVREPTRARALEPLAGTLGVRLAIRRLADGHERSADIVISTLPGGADPGILFPSEFRAHTVLLDVAYDPWPSQLASAWSAAGGSVVSGLAMLTQQALLQVRIFVSGDQHEPLPDEARVLAAMLGSVGLDSCGTVPES